MCVYVYVCVLTLFNYFVFSDCVCCYHLMVNKDVYIYIYILGMCGMDFSSSVRFRFGFDKNRGFDSVSVSVRF